MGTFNHHSPTRYPHEEHSTEGSYPVNKLKHRIEIQTKQIDSVLVKNNIPAFVKGGTIWPNWLSFDLQVSVANGIERLQQVKNELISALGVSELRFRRENGAIKLLLNKHINHPVDLLDLLGSYDIQPGVTATLGLDSSGRPIVLDLFEEDFYNVLIAGKEGAGKSSLLRTIGISLALTNRQSNVQLTIVTVSDRSRGFVSRPSQLFPLNYLPHLLFPVAGNLDEAIDSLEFLVDEVRYRAENQMVLPILILLIDDIDILLRLGGRRVRSALTNLLSAPSVAGLRVIMSARELTESGLSELVKHNIQLRLVGSVENSSRAEILTGVPESGAEVLGGQGDFLAISYLWIHRFQAAYVDDYELHWTLSELHRRNKTVLIANPPLSNNQNVPSESKNSSITYKIDQDSKQLILGNVYGVDHDANNNNLGIGEIIDPEILIPDSSDMTHEQQIGLTNNEKSFPIDQESERIDNQNTSFIAAGGPRKRPANQFLTNELPLFEKKEDPHDKNGDHNQPELEYRDLDDEDWFPIELSEDELIESKKLLH